SNFWITAIVSGIVSLILGGLATIFRKKWLRVVQVVRSYVFNASARVTVAVHVRKYPIHPESFLSNSVYKAFTSTVPTEEITKRAIDESSMRIYSSKLGLPVNVFLQEDSNVSEELEEKSAESYKATVELDGELRIGFRNVSDFQEFQTVATKMQDAVREQCFMNKRPAENFLICEVSRKIRFQTRVLKDKFDSDLQVRVSIKDSTVNLVCEEPSYAVNAIRKYFPL